MKKLAYIIIGFLVISCGSNSFKTEAGTVVTYLKNGEGDILEDSTAIRYFNLRYLTESGSEIFATKEPAPMRVGGSFSEEGGELFQILPQLKVSDSVTFKIKASDFFQNTLRAPRPDSIPAESQIEFFISLEKLQTQEEYYQEAASKQKEMMESVIDTAQLKTDLAILDEYYAENNIELTTTTKNGVGIVVTEKGTGSKPGLGQTVQVAYSGYMLDGEYFDSNVKEVAMEQGLYDERREPYQPYPVQLYLTSVITGWHEAIAELNEGSKATIYIPSPLGYGPRRRSDVIVENSILVFDVELIEEENL